MTPSVWIALGSLGVPVFVQAVLFAFLLGKLFQDVATLKISGVERAAQGLAIARLEVQVAHVSGKIDDISGKIDKRLEFLTEPPVYQPKARRPAKDDAE